VRTTANRIELEKKKKQFDELQLNIERQQETNMHEKKSGYGVLIIAHFFFFTSRSSPIDP